MLTISGYSIKTALSPCQVSEVKLLHEALDVTSLSLAEIGDFFAIRTPVWGLVPRKGQSTEVFINILICICVTEIVQGDGAIRQQDGQVHANSHRL